MTKGQPVSKTDSPRTSPQRRWDYLSMPEIARLLEVSPSRIRQWVRGTEDLPAPFPAPDVSFRKTNGSVVPWWRETRRKELLAWRRRHLRSIASKFRGRPRNKWGSPRVYDDPASIAGIFVSQAPLDILNALAALSHAADALYLTESQFAVVGNATDLAALMRDCIPQDNAPHARLRAILERVTTARHAHVISDGGAINQFQFLLRRLGCAALINQFRDEEAAPTDAVPPDEVLDRARNGGLTPADLAKYPRYFIGGPGEEFAT
jgi:hypothetical protein